MHHATTAINTINLAARSGRELYCGRGTSLACTVEEGAGLASKHGSWRAAASASVQATGDHLGNNRVLFSDRNGDGAVDSTEIIQENHYYAFGLEMKGSWQRELGVEQRYRFNGIEHEESVGLDLAFYRSYDPVVGRWIAVDPLASKMPSWSPFNYTFNNPIRYIDPDGTIPETVKPGGSTDQERQEALTMIRNTVSSEDAEFIQLDANGNIDKGLLNSHSSSSENYAALSDLVNSEQVVEVSLATSFDYVDSEGNPGTSDMGEIYQDEYSTPDLDGDTMGGTTTGEEGFMGKTLFPDLNGMQNSPDGVLRVIVNSNMSEAGRAEMYSHEANGHARIYINTGNREAASHTPDGMRETNTQLKSAIIQSKKETIRHMKSRH